MILKDGNTYYAYYKDDDILFRIVIESSSVIRYNLSSCEGIDYIIDVDFKPYNTLKYIGTRNITFNSIKTKTNVYEDYNEIKRDILIYKERELKKKLINILINIIK